VDRDCSGQCQDDVNVVVLVLMEMIRGKEDLGVGELMNLTGTSKTTAVMNS
jgi:hypothetical protein